MSADAKDRILDACLEEVLGGQTPPDFAARIAQMLDSSAASENGTVQANAVASPEGISPTVRVAPKQVTSKRRQRSKWPSAVLAASALATVLSVGALTFQLLNREEDRGNSVATPSGTEKRDQGGAVVDRETVPPIKNGRLVDVGDNNFLPDRPEASTPFPQGTESGTQLAQAQSRPDGEVVALINEKLEDGWLAHNVAPSEAVDEETWCRRLFNTLLGREPSDHELDSFVADQSENRRAVLFDRLITDPAYSSQLAARFASVWSDLLIGPARGRRPGDLANRAGLEMYLRESFAANKPLDTIARELISASGSGKPGAAEFNGATNFLLAHMDRKGATATAHIGRVFLGQRVKCAQCHNHAQGDEQLAQRDFWQLNSFLRQVDFEHRLNSGEFALLDRDFDGEGNDSSDAEIYFETPDGRLQVAYPVLDGKAIPTSGYVDDVNRRQELAKLVTGSPKFSQAFVNHYWRNAFSYGLPADTDNELLDELAREFRASGFDGQRLLRWMVMSDAFSLSSEAPRALENNPPEFGGVALFNRFYQRTVKTEPVATGLAAASQAYSDGSISARMDWFGKFVPQDPTISARELIAPSSALPVIGHEDRDLIRKLSAAEELTFNDKVEHLFWATVIRNPTTGELKLANELYDANNEDSFAALEAVWLVLNNSDECVSE